MVLKRIIPDAYTEYEDGHLGVVPASLANVEAKVGGAQGGIPGKVYTLAGPDAKKMAKTVFKSGPLLQALEEAFDAGSTRIHAVRIGSPKQATLKVKDVMGTEFLKLKGDYGTSGNNHHVNVMHAFDDIESGFAAVHEGAPTHSVVFYDDTFEVVREVDLDAAISLEGCHIPSGYWSRGTTPCPVHW